MKTIKNSYHKKLSFPLVGVSIDTNEMKTVTDEQATQLLKNKWIIIQQSVASERKSVIADTTDIKRKGRK